MVVSKRFVENAVFEVKI